eukprot:scaffold2163_cov120-Isochrysis_galbana.AAC.5
MHEAAVARAVERACLLIGGGRRLRLVSLGRRRRLERHGRGQRVLDTQAQAVLALPGGRELGALRVGLARRLQLRPVVRLAQPKHTLHLLEFVRQLLHLPQACRRRGGRLGRRGLMRFLHRTARPPRVGELPPQQLRLDRLGAVARRDRLNLFADLVALLSPRQRNLQLSLHLAQPLVRLLRLAHRQVGVLARARLSLDGLGQPLLQVGHPHPDALRLGG